MGSAGCRSAVSARRWHERCRTRSFLFRSPGEQSPATVGGLVPFLPVFKTGRAGQPPAWKVRLLRRVVARWRCPRERRGRRPTLEMLLVASAPLGDVRTSARLPVGAESGSLAETAAWATNEESAQNLRFGSFRGLRRSAVELVVERERSRPTGGVRAGVVGQQSPSVRSAVSAVADFVRGGIPRARSGGRGSRGGCGPASAGGRCP